MGTPRLPEQTVRQVIELLKDHSLGHRQIAQRAGVSKGAVGNIAIEHGLTNRKKVVTPNVPQSPAPAQGTSKAETTATRTDDIKSDSWTISLPNTRICTLEEMVEHCKIDLQAWEVDRFVCNKWEVGIKKGEGEEARVEVEPLYQVKVWLRRRLFSTTEGYIEDNARLRSQLEKLKTRFQMETQLTKRLAVNHFGFDDWQSKIKEVSEAIGKCSIPPTRIAARTQRKSSALSPDHSEDAVLLISDTHYGERIRREDTAGFQEVDLVTQGNRTGVIAKSAKEILTLHRQMYPIDTLHVWLGGDIGNGDLHGASLSNSLNNAEQVHFSVNMLRSLLRDLLELTQPDPESGVIVVKRINLLFTVGNHMRMDEKMPYKIQARRTFDWLIYQVLIDEFESCSSVTINRTLAPYLFENIRGHRYLFCHGFQVGYRNSPDAQGKSVSGFMTRARALFDSRQWRKENNLDGETFSRACIGDIHVPLSFPRFVSNASLSGQNELGANWMLEPIPAGMQMFGVSDKHQETWKYFIDVTHVGKDSPNAYARFAERYQKDRNQ